MVILSFLLQLIPFSLIILWITRVKAGEKFSRRELITYIALGAASLLIVHILSVPIVLFWRFNNPDPSNIVLNGFVLTLFTAAIPEELCKYLVFRSGIRKAASREDSSVKVWLDAVLVCCLIAMGFSLFEDLIYALDGGLSMVLRGFLPIHFFFQTVMGYYYGKGAVTGEKKWHVLSLLLPILLHFLLDFPIICITQWEGGDAFAIIEGISVEAAGPLETTILILICLEMAAIIVFVVLMILSFVKITKWSRRGALRDPLFTR